MSNASFIDGLTVRPILDIQGIGPAIHALRDLSPSRVREGTLWTFLAYATPFPKPFHLYWELPADLDRAQGIIRRLLAVPSSSRASFERLILQLPSPAVLIADSHLEALRASRIRLATWAATDAREESRLQALHPDYVRAGVRLLRRGRVSPRFESIAKKAWDQGAAVLVSGVRSQEELDGIRRCDVRLAEGPLFGREVLVRQLTKSGSPHWNLGVALGRGRSL